MYGYDRERERKQMDAIERWVLRVLLGGLWVLSGVLVYLTSGGV